MTDLPLIKIVAQTKKTRIISTGMSSLDEIDETFKVAKKNGAKEIILLYCVSNYPAKNKDFNLNNIQILKNKFNCKVGLSDHSLDNTIAISSIAAGAEIVEKHIGLDGQKNGLDIKFSLKGKKIKVFKKLISETYNSMGKNFFYRNPSEEKSKIFRRSIFAVKDIKVGEKFTKKNIRRIRPGYGLEPKLFDKILGKKSNKNISAGSPLKKRDIK